MEGVSAEELGEQEYALIHWAGRGAVALPEGEDFLRADFVRSGPDLLIDTPAGGHFVVVDYFMAVTPAALHTADGHLLPADVVARLAGPATPSMVAQASGIAFTSLGEPIGQVSEVEGGVAATHADGVKVALSLGDPIFQGDVLETGPKGSTSIVFVDDSIFTLNGDGRMVIDEMVYDPGSQTGSFNTQVVQGVFSFVSGKIAKTSPDGMVLSTPTSVIGIRGSTGLIRAAGEGFESKITLVRDVDGNVGEIVISNAAGTLVLNQAGATTSVFSTNGAPTPIIILSPQELQQNFGQNLTRLVKVVAKKAQADAQKATEQAQKSGQDAQQADAEAKQASDEAQQADEAASQADQEAAAAEQEAEDAKAEAEAAKAAAEAADNAEAAAKAAAAEAKAAAAAQKAADAKAAAEAQAKAAAEAKLAAEAKIAAAEAKAAEALAAQAQAEQAQQFNQMADLAFTAQSQAFEQFQQTAPPPGSGAPDGPPGAQGGPGGTADKAGTAGKGDTAGDGPPDDGDAAAKAAYEKAIAEGASPEEAFNAAAMAASGGNMDDPAVAIARAAFEEAIASGASPEEAMKAAQGAVAQFDLNNGPFDNGSHPQDGFGFDQGMPGVFGFNDMGDMGGPYFNQGGDPYFNQGGDPYFDQGGDPYGLGPYDGAGYDFFTFNGPFYDGYDIGYDVGYYEDPNLTHNFSETIVAQPGGGTMAGGVGNTNFYFRWGYLNAGSSYTVTDAGGTNQIAFDSLNAVSVKVVFGALGTEGNISVFNDTTVGNQVATVAFSSIHQFLLSDVYVAGFNTQNYLASSGGDVMVLGGMAAGETGYVIAGTDAAETFNLNATNYANLKGAIVFAKGGGDTINISLSSGDLTVIGGITSSDNVLADNVDLLPDSGLNSYDYTTMAYSAGNAGLKVLMYGYGNHPAGDVLVTDAATGKAFYHDLWDVSVFTGSAGNDTIGAKSGYFHALFGGAGADTIGVDSSAYFYTVDAGTENDTVTINTNLLQTATSINGGAGADKLIITNYTGGATTLNSGVITGFETIVFDAHLAHAGATTTALDVNTTFAGSSYADTFTGGAGNDIFLSDGGADTLTGGAGSDIFVYNSGTGSGDHITDYNAGLDRTYIEKTVIGNNDTVWDAGEFVKLGALADATAIQSAINANGHTTSTAFAVWNQASAKAEAWYDNSAALTGDTAHVLTYDNITLSQFNAFASAADMGLVLVDTTVFTV